MWLVRKPLPWVAAVILRDASLKRFKIVGVSIFDYCFGWRGWGCKVPVRVGPSDSGEGIVGDCEHGG